MICESGEFRACEGTSAGILRTVNERVGILGGTFDPIHSAHVAIAISARRSLALDRVVLIPAGDPWQKSGKVVASAEQRLEMARLAVEGIEGLEVSDIEVLSSVPSVTADTLEALAREGRELFLILGADAVVNMPSWRRLDETRELATIVVVEREGESAFPPGDGWSVEHVRIDRFDVSSSLVRERLRQGLPIDGLVPAPTAHYIQEHGLYTQPQ